MRKWNEKIENRNGRQEASKILSKEMIHLSRDNLQSMITFGIRSREIPGWASAKRKTFFRVKNQQESNQSARSNKVYLARCYAGNC